LARIAPSPSPEMKKPLEGEAVGSYRGRAALLPALLEKLRHQD
jgi:hypothetical protein